MINIDIISDGKDGKTDKKAEVKEGVLLSEVFIREGLGIPMPCGGMGRCGKCRVHFNSGAPAPTDADQRVFSEKELQLGMRLACRAVLTEDAVVLVSSANGNMLPDAVGEVGISCKNSELNNAAVALDIGTTTIAAALIRDTGTKKETVAKRTVMNHQSSFGADVITRIQKAGEGFADDMQSLVKEDIDLLIKELSADTGCDIKSVTAAGNTTMLHLLLGDSCTGLGHAPYTPVRLSYPVLEMDDVLGKAYKPCLFRIFGGISAFIGADIVSGMYALGFDDIPRGKKYMLIDLGTNGEMAVADSEKILVSSTAAGPAFEGVGISCGMPGIEGAIEHVTIRNGKLDAKTIGGKVPIGICGSGVLELVSELRREGIIDETGLLSDEYFDEGYSLWKGDDSESGGAFTQDDIRQVQLAKAAIRSGIDTLISEYGCKPEDIDRVFVAGGFSEHLETSKIRFLNMFPEEFFYKTSVTCVGNTSLAGCIKAVSDPEYEKKAEKIVSISSEVVLSNVANFGDAYFEAMNF